MEKKRKRKSFYNKLRCKKMKAMGKGEYGYI